MPGVHHKPFNMVTKVMSRNYFQGYFVEELNKLHKSLNFRIKLEDIFLVCAHPEHVRFSHSFDSFDRTNINISGHICAGCIAIKTAHLKF